jgi:methylenetetrahydrofolate dehydrogenase (NADP+)/methenyltetrahydrofolate cyclohydrolase
MTMTAQLIEGKTLAAEIREGVSADVAELKSQGITPTITVVYFEDRPDSKWYLKSQRSAAKKCDVEVNTIAITENVTEAEVLGIINDLNNDVTVHGITLHLPMPKQVDSQKVLEAVSPEKDIEGTHPLNLGLLMVGPHSPVPCAAAASVELCQTVHPSLRGMNVVVVGRGSLVGKPLAMMLLNLGKDAPTPTTCHTATADLAAVCREADVIFAAAGRAHLVTGDMVKPGATLIDAGINELEIDGETKLVGDIDFDAAAEVAGHITPVPGGVGPLCTAIMLRNVIACCRRQQS